uniref:Uncharacterized protein n=1 Tax=Romanomermis culicivorax TaxID=13658 RepID=A0A915HLR7_ROMCU
MSTFTLTNSTPVMHRMRKAAHWAIFTQRLKKVVRSNNKNSVAVKAIDYSESSSPNLHKFGDELSYCSSYTGSSESEEDPCSPKEKIQKNSKGFVDFCVKNIKYAELGRREIDMAEHGQQTLIFHFE